METFVIAFWTWFYLMGQEDGYLADELWAHLSFNWADYNGLLNDDPNYWLYVP